MVTPPGKDGTLFGHAEGVGGESTGTVPGCRGQVRYKFDEHDEKPYPSGTTKQNDDNLLLKNAV
jgi:hypothetical protein